MLNTIFARKPMNLNQAMDDIEEMKYAYGFEGDAYYVAQELQVSAQEWKNMTEDFMAYRPCFHQFSQRNLRTTKKGAPCIRVTTPGSKIALIIITEGCDYARYVGIEEN